MSEFEKNMLAKIKSGEKLTERELRNLTECEIDRTEGDHRRWTQTIDSICKLGDEYYCIVWEKGLTECQENEFYTQPYKVEKKEYEKTITVTEWIRV